MSEESNILTIMIEEPSESESGGIRYSAYSSIGARASQQDTLFVGEKPGELLAVICDGMGGLQGGEQASGLAVQLLAESFYSREEEPVPGYYRRMAVLMDEKVSELERDGMPMGAGSTIVSVLIAPDGMYWLSVGDSRIYLYREGEMLCPVPAHNYRLLLDQKLASGKISQETYEEELPRGEALISFLGLGGIRLMEINQNPFQLLPGDQILLCSDGLYKSLEDEEIRSILGLRMTTDVKVKYLVDEALKRGGSHQDNTSVILLQM